MADLTMEKLKEVIALILSRPPKPTIYPVSPGLDKAYQQGYDMGYARGQEDAEYDILGGGRLHERPSLMTDEHLEDLCLWSLRRLQEVCDGDQEVIDSLQSGDGFQYIIDQFEVADLERRIPPREG